MAQDPEHAASVAVPLARGTRMGAVVSRYHAELTEAMFESAARELAAAGLAAADLVRVDVPGAFELPLIARRLALRDDLACVLCFALVLKGETTHDRYIADAVAHALQRIALEHDKPILFGVLTCDTLEQAQARALSGERGGRLDKGREVARSALGALAALERAGQVGLTRPPAGFGRGARQGSS
jgi:6,7-dimethyl-8-ribityllumazine synthase